MNFHQTTRKTEDTEYRMRNNVLSACTIKYVTDPILRAQAAPPMNPYDYESLKSMSSRSGDIQQLDTSAYTPNAYRGRGDHMVDNESMLQIPQSVVKRDKVATSEYSREILTNTEYVPQPISSIPRSTYADLKNKNVGCK